MQIKGQEIDVAILEVQDNGPAFPKRCVRSYSTRFLVRKERGRELGLAIAARIADNHGGKLELDTEPRRRHNLPSCAAGNWRRSDDGARPRSLSSKMTWSLPGSLAR